MNIHNHLKRNKRMSNPNVSDPNASDANAMQSDANSKQSIQSDPNAIQFDPDPIKNDFLNRSMFGNNYQQMTYDEKNKIYQDMLKFKCLD